MIPSALQHQHYYCQNTSASRLSHSHSHFCRFFHGSIFLAIQFNTNPDTYLTTPPTPPTCFLATMSYFTMVGSEYDLPHPTLSRHPPRFYIPDRSDYSPAPTTAGYPREPLSMHSRIPSSSTMPYSGHSTPYHAESFYGSGSRSSIAALRHALHTYHQHAQGQHPLTPQQQISRPPIPRGILSGQGGGIRGGDSSPGEPHDLGDPTANLPPDLWGRQVNEPLEALIDIHRVLYRGGEDPAETSAPAWSEQGREVKRVMEQWFEGDCSECVVGSIRTRARGNVLVVPPHKPQALCGSCLPHQFTTIPSSDCLLGSLCLPISPFCSSCPPHTFPHLPLPRSSPTHGHSPRVCARPS